MVVNYEQKQKIYLHACTPKRETKIMQSIAKRVSDIVVDSFVKQAFFFFAVRLSKALSTIILYPCTCIYIDKFIVSYSH